MMIKGISIDFYRLILMLIFEKIIKKKDCYQI